MEHALIEIRSENPWEDPYREHEIEVEDSMFRSDVESDASYADGGDAMLEQSVEQTTETATTWSDVCALDDLSIGAGTAVLVGNRQIAVFRISSAVVKAVQNVCPHKAAAVMHQGIVGDREGHAVVMCPLHKRAYRLDDGVGLDEPGARLKAFACRIRDGRIEVGS